MENVADIYDKSLVTPVCLNITRWTAHDPACRSLCEGYKQFLHALGVCLNGCSEPEATRIFVEINDGTFSATILMLRDVFEAVQLLNLVLQKGDGSLCLAEIPVYFNKTLQGLKKLDNSDCCKWCQEKKFNELKTLASDEALKMSLSANLRNASQSDFDSFIQSTYMLFIQSFTEEITEALKKLDFWLSFVIFDPRKLPTDEDFTEYGMSELDKLSSFYGVAKIDHMNGEVSS